jgi:hypothetical protein
MLGRELKEYLCAKKEKETKNMFKKLPLRRNYNSVLCEIGITYVLRRSMDGNIITVCFPSLGYVVCTVQCTPGL